MTKKLLNPEESKPHGYFREGETVKKTDKSSTESLVNSMRTDMVPASSALPESKKIIQRVNLKAIGGGFIGLVILGLIWLALAGPGRPFLEQNLAKLLKIKSTSTQLEVPNSMNVTNTPAKPIITLSASPTFRPTYTPTIKIVASPAHLPSTNTPIPLCRDVLSITLADIGQTLCVQGTVIEIINLPDNFMLIFSDEPGAFYWVSYDMVWSKAEINTCYQIHGMIRQIANSPILVFDYSNIPEVCP